MSNLALGRLATWWSAEWGRTPGRSPLWNSREPGCVTALEKLAGTFLVDGKSAFLEDVSQFCAFRAGAIRCAG